MMKAVVSEAMRIFLANLELILTAAGLMIVFVATIVAEHMGVGVWPAAALSALLVGVIHGLLFWVVRRRQRQVRGAAIRDIQAMLSDIINNQLTLIEAAQYLKETGSSNPVHKMSESVGVISETLKDLSEESLRTWQVRYARPVESAVSGTMK